MKAMSGWGWCLGGTKFFFSLQNVWLNLRLAVFTEVVLIKVHYVEDEKRGKEFF